MTKPAQDAHQALQDGSGRIQYPRWALSTERATYVLSERDVQGLVLASDMSSGVLLWLRADSGN